MKRYAVAYKRFPEDSSVFYEDNAICMFQQDEGTVEILKKHYLVWIPVREEAEETYTALEKAISEKIGQECELVFTRNQPTVWRVKTK